jgi:hypothetical protein
LRFRNGAGFIASLRAGSTAYLSAEPQMGIVTPGQITLVQVTENQGRADVASLHQPKGVVARHDPQGICTKAARHRPSGNGLQRRCVQSGDVSRSACSNSDRAAERISATAGFVTPALEMPFSIQMSEMPAGWCRRAEPIT